MPAFDEPVHTAKHRVSVWLKLLLGIMFLGTAAVFAGWWFVSPQGFDPEHLRFWVNSVFPPFVITGCAVSLYGIVSNRGTIVTIAAAALAFAAFTATVTAGLLYPVSLQPVLLVLAGSGVIVLGLFAVLAFVCFPVRRRRPVLTAAALLLFGGTGVLLVWSQRSAPAQTAPLNVNFPAAEFAMHRVGRTPYTIGDRLQTTADYQGIVLECGQAAVEVRPLLTFISRSPDRFWTLFAPRSARRGPKRILDGLRLGSDTTSFHYTDDGESYMEITPSADQQKVEIQTYTQIPAAVYSHLNAYTQLVIRADAALSISFSPCPDARIELTAYDYPFGRPAKTAYLGEDGQFHVVRAANAEKGPFRTLAAGPLKRDEPIAFTVYADAQAVCRVELKDWAQQASTQVSPTAGWGLPENAIAFNLIRENPPVGFIHITLADTSVGRGFDSVGHNPGVYRNRLVIERLDGLD